MTAVKLTVMGKQSSTVSEREDSARRIGQVIRQKRLERGLPATELARRSKLALSYLSHLEGGHFQDIRMDKFARLIEVLNLSADEILQEAGYLPRQARPALPELDDYLRSKFG